MARISSELAVKQVGSRYDLILIASRRARELRRGDAPHINTEGSGPVVTALKEIEAGHIGRDYLAKNPDINNEPRKKKQ